MVLPHVPFDPDEESFSQVRAAQQLRRMAVEPVLVEPDSPAQSLRHRGYYVPAGYFHPAAPAAVILREDYDGDGGAEAAAMVRGAMHHAAARLGIRAAEAIIACDEAASPCSPDEETLLRGEFREWWSWWAPRSLPVAAHRPHAVAGSRA